MLNIGSIWNSPLICACVSGNDCFGCADCCFLAIKGSSNFLDSLEHPVNVIQMLPNKPLYLQILRDHLVCAVQKLVSGFRALNRYIIHKWNGYMRNFVLQDMRDVSMHNLHHIGISHQDTSELFGSERGLKRGKVSASLVERPLIEGDE